MTPAFVEAYRCDRAAYYLLWERLHGNTYGWAVHHGNQVVGTLDGYPIDTPARTSRDAVPWAADLTGIPADHWVQHPPRSGAFHTHEKEGVTVDDDHDEEDQDPHGGCIEPHLRGDGELYDCDGRAL